MSATSALYRRRERNPGHGSDTQVHILLIEDCASDVYLVERMLHDASPSEEFDIMDVPRLADAFRKLDGNRFDLIILDLNLLDIDGVASVAALRAECPAIPILVYSGSEDPKLRNEALLCGATHYLVKGRESGYSLRFVIKQVLMQKNA
jgi:DNA-binding response OmpR family regulator